MKKYYLFIFSILLIMLIYAVPAYSGTGSPGCCQNGGPGSGCLEVNFGPDDCNGRPFFEGYVCDGNAINGTCVSPALGCCNTTGRATCMDEVTAVDCDGQGPFVEGGICDNNGQCNLPVNPDHLMCYQVKDELRFPKESEPRTIYIDVPQFQSQVRCELKGRTVSFCAPACKAKQGDPPVGGGLCQPNSEIQLAYDRVCYRVEDCTEIEGHIKGLERYVTDQFDELSISSEGPRLFENFNPHEICTLAYKCTGGCEDLYPGDSCGSGKVCDINCQCVESICGNGILEFGEECDDGGQTGNCDIDCTNAVCGDGYTNVMANEDCDGGGVDTAECNVDCTFAMCGDLYVNAAAGEECDSGGSDTPGCDGSFDCTFSECGDGYLNTFGIEQCDPPAGNSAQCSGLECTVNCECFDPD